MSEFSVFGKSLPRIDAWSKATGEVKYLDDIKIQGMLYGKILRSPHAHAKIVSIDTFGAKKLPGVRAVITAEDTPGIKFSFVPALADKLPLCKDKVRYVGDEVAAVAADSLEIAEKAIQLIKAEYEILPAVFDVEEAMKQDAPLIHEERENNIAFEGHKSFGDVEKGFRESDYIFEDRCVTSKVTHCCMETHGCIALFDKLGKLTIYSPHQAPHTVRQEMARILALPLSRVRVIRTPVGGGFGQRLVTDMKEPVAAILSRTTGRAVKIVNTREEEFCTARTRYPYIIYLKTGVRKDGKILARQAKVIVDNGAYNDKGPSTLNYAGECFAVLYNVPHIQYDGWGVYTNKQFGTAFRGFGNPQLHFATETQLDAIAKKLHIDPQQLRLKYANMPGDVAASGAKITSCGLVECINKAAESSRWKEKRKEPVDMGDGKCRGIGMAAMVHTGGGGRFYGYAATDTFVKISEEGKVTVISPAPEIGQGATMVIAQITAEVLGIRPDNITVINDDTEIMPYDLGAWGSRTSFVCGNAAKSAAENTREEVIKVAAQMLQRPAERLGCREGKVFLKDNPEVAVFFEEVAGYAISKIGHPLSGRGRYFDPLAPQVGLDRKYGHHLPTFAFACQVVEVEVDTLTGQVKVLKVTAAHDTGRTINPSMAEGQIEGSILQGLGYALSEECVEKDGILMNPNFADYKIWTALDTPSYEVILVESIDPDGPFGAKGIGEPGLVPLPAAVANAIFHATGVMFRQLPLNQERVFFGLREAKK
ncbi:molybdopterin-dependent oxidoreductase [Candidatus Aerophobetes bacterium]|nr:molybdopterin-dependent oxidoreductase [Candidatus Aerophobetes bacterium]